MYMGRRAYLLGVLLHTFVGGRVGSVCFPMEAYRSLRVSSGNAQIGGLDGWFGY